MLESQRHLFDIPEDIAYFNAAYNTPLLKESVRRLQEGVISKSHAWERMPLDFFNEAESLRELSAKVFGGNANNYVTIPSASYGLSTAARILEPTLEKGDKILLLEDDFPSIVFPLKRVANETGAGVVTVPTPQDGNWVNAIAKVIDSSVQIVALSSCHWTNGAYIDLVKVRAFCDSVGAVLIIDATQSMGVMPFLMDEIRPDFLVVAGYKWLLCPYGFTLFYVSDEWHNQRPLEETWLARDRAEDFNNLANYSDTYKNGARRYEMGEKCIPTILPGAIAALEQIGKWGVNNIAESLQKINDTIAVSLKELGFGIPAHNLRCPHMLGATLPDHYNDNLVSQLRAVNIYISQRGNSLRFAPHVYVNENDISRLLTAIEKIMN